MNARTPADFETWLRAATLLVADHDHFRRPATCNALRSAGARLIGEAADGLAAIDAIRRCTPDLALLRDDLPIFDSVQVIQIVRSLSASSRQHPQFVVLTSAPGHSSELFCGASAVTQLCIDGLAPEEIGNRLSCAIDRLRPSDPAHRRV